VLDSLVDFDLETSVRKARRNLASVVVVPKAIVGGSFAGERAAFAIGVGGGAAWCVYN